MLLVAVSISIYQFTTLSKSVEALIENNYKTIQACQEMLGALEREDSGILLLLLGKWTEGREMVQSADITFNRSLELARNNVTEEGEDVLIQDLENQYANFKSHWERPIVGTDKEGDLKWYFNTIYESFINTTSAIEKLLILNQESMYASALDLKERAKRALMPGIVAIIAALFFVLMFNVFINAYFIRPIVDLMPYKNLKIIERSLI